MSTVPSRNEAKGGALHKALFPSAVAAVMALFVFGYWTVHREPDGATASRQHVEAQEKSAAKNAVEACWNRAKVLPARSGESQIAQDACQLLQKQYEQAYRLTP